MLWAMSHGGSLQDEFGVEAATAGVDDFDWVMQVCCQPFGVFISFNSKAADGDELYA